MKTEKPAIKEKRKTVTFDPDETVGRMLADATEGTGITKTDILNAVMLAHGASVIAEEMRKRQAAIKGATAALNRRARELSDQAAAAAVSAKDQAKLRSH